MVMRFQRVDRDTPYLFPPSVQDWLPEDHLARFVVEAVERLDLRPLEESYGGRGSAAYHPRMLTSLLFYGGVTGVHSSRQLERATHDSVAFRYIAANRHPDHDTISEFRRRAAPHLPGIFLQILQLAQEMGFLKVGRVSVDGSKIQANASKHSALSWGHASRLEEQLKGEVAELMRLGEGAESQAVAEGMDIPAELARREERLKAIEAAKKKLEARAAERHAAEQAEYEAKLAQRQEKARATGKRPGGKDPKPPPAGVSDKDQINLTDEESRIMPSGGGFEQAYNAQIAVDTESLLIVAQQVSQKCNDKKQIEPMAKALEGLPAELGKARELLADNGYYSAENVQTCVGHQLTPYLAVDREEHHVGWMERFTDAEPAPAEADPVTEMKQRLKTRAGRAVYALRKCTVEPVFGIIKSVMGYRRFLRRGLEAVSAEWTLVCIAWNLKRLFNRRRLAALAPTPA